MRHFEEVEEQKYDKLHLALLLMFLFSFIAFFGEYAQVYKQKVEFSQQISSLKSDLSFCQKPEGTLGWEDL